MRLKLSLLTLWVLFLGFFGNEGHSFAQMTEYTEKGRFGMEGLITQQGFKAGFTRETDQYEISLDANGNSNLSGPSANNFAMQVRGGFRNNLGNYNYLSYGIFYGKTISGETNNISTVGSFRLAPYIGVQRHFSGTNLMLTLFVLPYAYDHEVNADGKGTTANSNLFFLGGGFGMAYLFD